MTTRALVAGIVAVAAAVAATPGAAGTGLGLTRAGSAEFPDRAYVLTMPKPTVLDEGDVLVRENGQAVTRVAVVPAGKAAGSTFGTVLVLDASNSMKGEAIARATAAARAFASRRPEGQALGLVTFNRQVSVVLQPTTDGDEIRTALASAPQLAQETHLYEAAAAAIDVAQKQGIAAPTIVLLTDGRDTGSRTTAEAVLKKARQAGVRIFAVGLRSPQFSPATLENLATGTGGAYVEAKSAASLKAIYSTLSQRLADEYLLRYKSLAGPRQKVVVEVKAAGIPGAARTTYTSPDILREPLSPFHRSPFDEFLTSPLSALLTALFVALVVAFTVRAILRRRDATVRSRVAQFVKDTNGGATDQPARTHETFLTQRLAAIDQALARTPWWDRFKLDIEIGEFPVQPVPLVLVTFAATLFTAVVLGTVFLPVHALFALGVPFIVRAAVQRRLRAKRERFAEQLPDNLLVMASSLRAGHSFAGSLSAVVDEADEPSKSELRRAVSDEQLGVPMENALINVAQRMDSGDLEQVALVASLQRETGGNTAAVLDTVVDTVRDRFELRRTVMTLTAQGRMARWILTFLPLAVFCVISLINPDYMKPLFTTGSGQVMITVAIVMVILGSLAIKRIVDIKL